MRKKFCRWKHWHAPGQTISVASTASVDERWEWLQHGSLVAELCDKSKK